MRFELLAAVVVGALVGTGSCTPATVDSATPAHTPRMIPYEVYKHIKSKQDEKKAATHAPGVRRDIDLASVASVMWERILENPRTVAPGVVAIPSAIVVEEKGSEPDDESDDE